MFTSVSQATPLSRVSTSFVAATNVSLLKVSNFDISVNGSTVTTNPISISAGDTVTATVTAPVDYLWYEFFYYTLDGVPQSFAVANESLYAIKVKPADAIKRWYLYTPTEHTLTFRTAAGSDYPITLGTTFGPLTRNIHVILDPLSDSVYFYNSNTVFLSKITLPGKPVDFIKLDTRDSIIVLLHSGESYEVYLNSDSAELTPFFALRDYSEFTGDLTYVSRLPGEDLITFLRRIRSKRAIPPATCLTYNGTYIIAAGNGSVWVVDPRQGFFLVNNFAIDEYVFNITPLPNDQGVLLVTQSQKVYTMDFAGNFSFIYQGSALWQPITFNGKVYIPESGTGKLLVFNPVTSLIEQEIQLNKFSPSYTTVAGGKMYVAGHDSERVLVFDSSMNQTEMKFSNKVTWVSVVAGTVMSSHYLKEYKILDVRDLNRVIELDFSPRTGPVSFIGTDVETVKTLGNDEVIAHTAEDCWLWVNGRRTESDKLIGAYLTDGDYVSVSYAARVPGRSRTNIVIGDTAYDYDVDAVAQPYYPRYIDFPILPVGEFGVHTRSFKVSKFFTPCLMSIEYGSLFLNDLPYRGDRLVYPEDKITIEVRTCKTTDSPNSALPIFTLGSRQYAIPISASPSIIPPTVIEDIDLAPSTHLVKIVDFAAFPSRYDYIIPGFYDITIKKNQVDITGNYYQQFGKNDILVVEYNSSRKKYDELDIYIIGEINYRFSAKNLVENLLPFNDFGNIYQPYTREFISTLTTDVTIPDYTLYNTPDYQYYSNTYVISGLTANSVANLSVLGGETYFVLNGNIVTTDTVYVKNGDNLGLARTIWNYFEDAATVIQHLPDPDDDLFADRLVGVWGVVNQEVISTKEIRKPNERTFVKSTILLDKDSTFQSLSEAVELISATDRKIFSYPESLDKKTSVTTSKTNLTTETFGYVNAGSAVLQLGTITEPDARAVTVETSHISLAEVESLITEHDLAPGRKIFAISERLDQPTALSATPFSISLENDTATSAAAQKLVHNAQQYYNDSLGIALKQLTVETVSKFENKIQVIQDSSQIVDPYKLESSAGFNVLLDTSIWTVHRQTADRKIFSATEKLEKPILFVRSAGRTIKLIDSDSELAGYEFSKDSFTINSRSGYDFDRVVEYTQLPEQYRWDMHSVTSVGSTPFAPTIEHEYAVRKITFAAPGELESAEYFDAEKYTYNKVAYHPIKNAAGAFDAEQPTSREIQRYELKHFDVSDIANKPYEFAEGYIKNMLGVPLAATWATNDTVYKEIWGTKYAKDILLSVENEQIIVVKSDQAGIEVETIDAARSTQPAGAVEKTPAVRNTELPLVGKTAVPIRVEIPLAGRAVIVGEIEQYSLLVDSDYHWQGFVFGQSSFTSGKYAVEKNDIVSAPPSPLTKDTEQYLTDLVAGLTEHSSFVKADKTVYNKLNRGKEVSTKLDTSPNTSENYLFADKSGYNVKTLNYTVDRVVGLADISDTYMSVKGKYRSQTTGTYISLRDGLALNTQGSDNFLKLVYAANDNQLSLDANPYGVESSVTYIINRNPFGSIETNLAASFQPYRIIDDAVYFNNQPFEKLATQTADDRLPYLVESSLNFIENRQPYEVEADLTYVENFQRHQKSSINFQSSLVDYLSEKKASVSLGANNYRQFNIATVVKGIEPIEKETRSRTAAGIIDPSSDSESVGTADIGYFVVKNSELTFSSKGGVEKRALNFVSSDPGYVPASDTESSSFAAAFRTETAHAESFNGTTDYAVESAGQFGYLIPEYGNDPTSAGTTNKGKIELGLVKPNLADPGAAASEVIGQGTLSKLIPGSLTAENVLTFKMPAVIEQVNDTAAPLKAEFEQGFVWNQDEGTFGAFETVDDAIYAARNYTQTRPFAIFGTDLFSFRVIIDTDLVCEIPKGRYPVAWLIRGG